MKTLNHGQAMKTKFIAKLLTRLFRIDRDLQRLALRAGRAAAARPQLPKALLPRPIRRIRLPRKGAFHA